MYDQDSKTLKLKRTDTHPFTTKFLDTTPTISPCRTSIKLIYNITNPNTHTTNTQEIGRFADPKSHSHITTKPPAFTCICVRMHDLTTHTIDMLTPLAHLITEARTLCYHNNTIISFLTRAHQICPSPIFIAAIKLVKITHQHTPTQYTRKPKPYRPQRLTP